MSDIVERLVTLSAVLTREAWPEPLVEDAADEILRLRAENEKLNGQAAMNGRLLTENAELREENRLVGLQMDRMADEIEKLRAELAEYKRNGIVDVTGSINYHSGYDEGLDAAANRAEELFNSSPQGIAASIRSMKERAAAAALKETDNA